MAAKTKSRFITHNVSEDLPKRKKRRRRSDLGRPRRKGIPCILCHVPSACKAAGRCLA